MANNYYTHGTFPTPNSPGSSALMRAELGLISAGFDKLPSLVAGNANKLVVVNGAGNALTVISTLNSLDVVDSGFVIQDDSDATKKAKFQVSGVTTGTTRTFTFPDADITLVGTANAQTLTNKTLGSGTVINAGTIDGVPVGGTTPAAGNFTTVAASVSMTVAGVAVTTASNTQTLTNKTISNGTLTNPTLTGGTMDGTVIGSLSPTSGTFTSIATTTGTVGGANIVTVSATQTLTNKTLTSPAVSGGTINDAVIGGTTAAAGTFTTLTATTSLTVAGAAATTASNTQTLTNKTISGATNTLSNIANASLTNSSVTLGSSSVSLGGTLTTIAGLSLTQPTIAQIVNGGTLTLPNSTDTLVGRATTDTLTNKTISGASNTFSNIPNTAITGLGTMSTQAANNVTISGGSITGITDLAVADGGTGSSTAAGARVNLLPSYTGNALRVLRLNSGATDVEWVADGGGTVTSVDVSGGTTGLTTSGGPVTGSGTITLAGTLAVANGGTGGTTAAAARANLLPAFATNSGKAIRVNTGETDIEYFTPITSVGITSTDLSVSGSPLTANGSITVNLNTVGVAKGGTGATTASGALVNLLPSYSGNSSKVLALNSGGTDVEWIAAGAGTVTSVGISSTDLSVSGSPITSSGSITINLNTVGVAKGGTGATTASGALVNLLPSYSSNNGKVLAINSGGTDVEWISVGGAGTVTSITAGTGLTGGTITSSGTLAIDTGVVVTLTDTQTLSNKTLTSPVISSISNTGTLTLPTSTDTLVGRATTDTLTNKTLSGANNTFSNIPNTAITGLGTMSTQDATSVAITGGTLAGITGFGLRNAGTGAFDLTVAHNGTLTAGRTLTLNVNDAARTVSLAGNVSLAGALTTAAAFTTSGANALTLTTTGATNVTLPTTGTLATLAGTETFTNKTLTNPTISGGTINNAAIGGTTPAAGTFTTLTANGNVTLGDNSADSLTIYPNTVTWISNPTHSGNHTFSGDFAIQGNTTIGNASGDTLTINAATVTYANATTVAGAVTYSGTQSFAASGIRLKGSSTGLTTFASSNSSATNYTITFPASTGTVLTTATAVTVGQGGTGVTTLTGLVKGNGTSAFSAAIAGTDYLDPSAIGVTVQAYDADTAKLDVAQSFTAQQTFKELKDTVHTIADGAAFEIDPANGSIQIVTLGASRTPAATNFEAGQVVLLGIDDGAGTPAYSINWSTVNPTWVKAGGTASAPALATSGYTWILLWKVGSTIYGTEVGSP